MNAARSSGAAALLAATLLLAAAAGCGRDDGSSPEGAVRALIASARAGDRLAVYQRLGPRTRARIEELLSSARKTGATRIVDGAADSLPRGCGTKEAAISWNQVGPQGPAGAGSGRRLDDRAAGAFPGHGRVRDGVLITRDQC
jgi:hypothetical protein